MSDADGAASYASTQPEFGGLFVDGDQLIVLFTADLERHENSLRRIIERPSQLFVRQATRTLAEVQRARTRVQERLMASADADTVSSIGIAPWEGQFAVEVGIDPHDDTRADRIRAAAHPDPVVVRPQPRPRTL